MATNPLENRLRYDKDATRLVIGYNEGYAPEALAIAPLIRNAKSGQYPSYGKGAWNYEDFSPRAIGDPEVKQITFPTLSWNEYFIPEIPRKKFIDYQTQGRSGVVAGLPDVDPTAAGKRLRKALNQALSKNIIDVALAGVGGTGTPTVKWNAAGADPITDMLGYIESFEAQCGTTPNGMIVPSKVFRYLGKGARLSYGPQGQLSNSMIVKEILMEDLGIPADRIFISKAHKYTTSFVNMYANAVLLFYSSTETVPSLATSTEVGDDEFQPSYMTSIIPDDVPYFRMIAPYEDSANKSGLWVKAIMEILPKVTLSYAGFSITATLE